MSELSSISFDEAMHIGARVSLSERALQEVAKIFAEEEPGKDAGLRISVRGGGCSGLSYEMDFGPAEEGDLTIDLEAIRLFLDVESAVYLRGTTVDYEGGLRGRGFVFRNPNARRTCSCGDSFAM